MFALVCILYETHVFTFCLLIVYIQYVVKHVCETVFTVYIIVNAHRWTVYLLFKINIIICFIYFYFLCERSYIYMFE